MRPSRVAAFVALASALCAEPLLAQGLASVAARTADERKALDGQPSVSRSNDDLPDDGNLHRLLQDFVLTREGFFRYVDARGLIMDVRVRVARVDQALLAAENLGYGPMAMQKLMTDEPEIKAMLDAVGISPGGYTLHEAAYRRAFEDAALPAVERDRLAPSRTANIVFVRSYEVTNHITSRWAQREKWMALQQRARTR
jgi:hypothetical protein